jgi:hypothetical protein
VLKASEPPCNRGCYRHAASGCLNLNQYLALSASAERVRRKSVNSRYGTLPEMSANVLTGN